MAAVEAEPAVLEMRRQRRQPLGTMLRRVEPYVGSLLLILFATLLIRWNWGPGRVSYRVGDVVTANVVAPRHVDYISQIETQSERQAATSAVGMVYRFDAGIEQQQQQRTLALLDRITSIRDNPTLTPGEQTRAVEAAAGPMLTQLTANDAILVTPSEWSALRAAVAAGMNQLLTRQIQEQDVEASRQQLLAGLPLGLSPEATTLAAQLLVNAVQPNTFPDPTETATARQDAAARSGPVHVVINRGETILHRGDRVRPQDIERLLALGMYGSGWTPLELLSSLLLVVCAMTPMLAYVRVFQQPIWSSRTSFGLLLVVVSLALVAARVSTVGSSDAISLYPVAAASMVIGAMLDVPLALLVTAVIGVMMGAMVDQPWQQITAILVGGTVGVLALWRVERLAAVFRAGLLVAVSNIGIAFSFALADGTTDPLTFGRFALEGLASGLLSATLTGGAILLFGHLFGITTAFQLMDLARPNQPLLQRLLLEAPGTYHHSLLVSNLAERAAVQIGADALLVRVGAFYHDIGKMMHPYFFIENQLDQPNIHSKLPPEVSAKMIAAHVTDGMRLADEYRLPRAIREIIQQHHGKRLIGIFLSLAQAQGRAGQPIDETKFRYPGPRPQSREAALVMLADATEAAVRAASHPSMVEVETIVGAIFRDRINEGELDDCQLTLHDMQVAREAFLTVLRGLFHRRIDYPAVAVMSDAE